MALKHPELRPDAPENVAQPAPRIVTRGRADQLLRYGLARHWWQDNYHSALTIPWWGFLLVTSGTYVGLNLLFACLYLAQHGAIANVPDLDFADAFFFSVQTMATIGYGGMAPATRFAHVLVTLESIVGILSTALITGATFAKFAKPTARVLFSQKIVVTVRHGVPTMMFRMANWRRNQVVEAQLRVALLIDEVSPEGDRIRRPLEIKLVRDRTALFFLSFQAMHIIDENSPFYGKGALDKLRAQSAQIYLTLTGMDETIGQAIHARCTYALDDIVWNARFADVISADPDGTRQIDYTKFHETVPHDPPAA